MAALLVALGAFWRAHSVNQRLERMSESYWELRYENGQMKARVARLEAASGLRESEPEPAAAPAAKAATTFVPLSSLKR